MPELPEVETIRTGLEKHLGEQPVIRSIKLLRKSLRYPIPIKITKVFANEKILSIERRAKFLLFKTKDYILISHLGMTGTWRISGDDKKHDHIHIFLQDGKRLVYNDPRRFGLLDLVGCDQLDTYKGIKNFGPEPFDTKKFSKKYFTDYCKTKSAPIKNVIMKQEFVVGVGNIYACEALFNAGIRPNRPANKLSLDKLIVLRKEILRVLRKAIQAGGSTISDFKQASGEEGYFQNSFQVYGREKEECTRCKRKIKNIKLAGRSSFYCYNCQK